MKQKSLGKVAIFGSTGLVGRELLYLLDSKKIPLSSLRLFASPESKGTTLLFQKKPLPVEVFHPSQANEFDLAFICTSETLSRYLSPLLVEGGARVIDNSSAFRDNPDVPLLIPEVNPEKLTPETRLISSPNCVVILLLTALAALHREVPISQILLSTYQAASGAGKYGLEALFNKDAPSPFPYPYLYNIFPHESPRNIEGFCTEEKKITSESQKILNAPNLSITATTVRVPVARVHSLSVYVSFEKPLSADRASNILQNAPGVILQTQFPTPLERENQEEVAIGPIRTYRDGLNLWIVGDQLLKGAALNALQIATLKESRHVVHATTERSRT